MSSTRSQWLLKVISGPHQGAEIALNPGKTLIGSDDECDVVLHDVLVAPQHLELELDDGGISAAPLGGRVFVGGKRIRDASQKVADFSFLSIGGSHLVIGRADAVWPLLSPADVPELEKEAETPPQEDPAEKSKSDTSAKDPAPPTPPPAGEHTPAQPPAPSALTPILGITAGVVLLLGWAFVYYDFNGGDPGAKSKPAEPVELARAIVEDMGLLGSVTIEESAGRLNAVGYVDTESQQRELQAAFRAGAPGLRTKIYNLEKIASSARSLIDSQNLPLMVSSLAEGKLKVTGTLPSAEPWIRMRRTLLNEVPGVSGIEDGVEIAAPRPVVAAAAAVASSAPPTAASISFSVPKPAAYEAPAPDPETDYLVTAETIDTPDATVATIRPDDENGLAYVRLSTGGVYFNGARLPYGGTIDRIESDQVTVIEKGVKRVLRQGDAAMKQRRTTATTP